MPTSPKLVAAEMAAGVAAAKKSLDDNVPGWERSMISDEAIQTFVADIVAAVDDVRDAADKKTK